MGFREGPFRAWEMQNSKIHDYGIKAVFGKRQRFGVGMPEVDRRTGLARQFDHGFGQIHTGCLGTAVCRSLRDETWSGRNIEDPRSRDHIGASEQRFGGLQRQFSDPPLVAGSQLLPSLMLEKPERRRGRNLSRCTWSAPGPYNLTMRPISLGAKRQGDAQHAAPIQNVATCGRLVWPSRRLERGSKRRARLVSAASGAAVDLAEGGSVGVVLNRS